MKIKDIATKKDKDLEKFIADQQGKLLKLRFEISTKESSKVSSVSEVSKNIAKALTIVNQRKLAVKETKEVKETK